MEVEYRNKSIEKVCTKVAVAEKKYGSAMAEKIQLRIEQISATPNIECLIQYHIGRCHPLHHQFAMDLVPPMRLVFEKRGTDIQIAYIMEIVDYIERTGTYLRRRTLDEESVCYIATPPGTTIKEQLDDRGMSQKEFASRMGMSEKHISHLINGDVKLTSDVAYRLELVLGMPAIFWSNLEVIYREKLAKVEAENALDADKEIAKKFPYSEMSKNAWLPKTRNSDERVINLRKFFEVVQLSNLSNENLLPNVACRRLSITEKQDFALVAWVQKAKLKQEGVQTMPIDLKELTRQLPAIRAMTTKDPAVFCSELCDLLANCGIVIVFLPHIGGSFLHGADV